MSSNKIFYILGCFSIFLITVSSVLMIRNTVVGFDILGSTNRNCSPYNVFVKRGEKDFSVDISWHTKGDCLGFVMYGKDRYNLDMVAVDVVNSRSSRFHTVTMEKILTSDVYYFVINSQDQPYGNNGVPLEFTLGDL